MQRSLFRVLLIVILCLIFTAACKIENETVENEFYFDDLGPINNSLAIAGGVIGLNDSGELVLFLTTKEEDPARLVIFNIINNSIENIIPIGNAIHAWGTAIDKDGTVYIGTRNKRKLAEVYKYHPKEKKIISIFTLKGESMVWSLAINDNNLYVGTYPHAKVYIYDIQKKKLRDLGCVSPGEESVRCLSIGSNNKIYAGVGPHASFAVFDPSTHKWRNIIPRELQNQSYIYCCLSYEGKLYAGTQPSGKMIVWDEKSLSLEAIIDTEQTTIDAMCPGKSKKIYITTRPKGIVFEYDVTSKHLTRKAIPKYRHQTRFICDYDEYIIGVSASGYIWKYGQGDNSIYNTNLREIGLEGASERITSMVKGPDGNIYMGGHRSFYSFNPKSGQKKYFWVPGEVQAIGSDNDFVYLGIYEGAELWRYDPKRLYSIHGDAQKDNPVLLGSVGMGQSRPHGIIQQYKNLCFLATSPYPGKLSGAVSMFDTNKSTVSVNKIINHSVYSLSICNKLLIAGTSIRGEGIQRYLNEAKLLVFRTDTFCKEFEIAPVPRQSVIYSILCVENIIYGLTDRGYIFAFEPNNGKILWKRRFFQKVQYLNSLGQPNLVAANDGFIYGTTGCEFFQLDRHNRRIKILKKTQTGHLVEGNDSYLYLNMGKNLFRCRPILSEDRVVYNSARN